MVKTGFITDRFMLKHRCEWEPAHMEVPERLSVTLDTLEDSNILSDCIHLEPRVATKEELQIVHDIEYINKIETTKDMNLEELETFSSQYEDVFLNSDTWKCSLLSAGSALELTDKLIKKELDNGFAAIRPPGHHAWKDRACGFCIFNNIAICAKYARSLGVERVLIVDWDVHAGQGTQYVIDDDPNIKLVSIHRYQNGKFWPHLPESAVNHKYNNTINIPLDRTGYGDSAYISIMHSVVLPLIGEWKPELILVSCGFDAALGDRDGGMKITPLGYEYMTGLLASQGIPLALILEGGYFLRIIGHAAVHAIKALKSQTVPTVKFGLENRYFGPLLEIWNPNLFQSINQIRRLKGDSEIEGFETRYEGEDILKTIVAPYPTRNLYTLRTSGEDEAFLDELRKIYEKYTEIEFEIKVFEGSEGNPWILEYNENEFNVKINNNNDKHFLYYQVLLPLSLNYRILYRGVALPLRPVLFFGPQIPQTTNIISSEMAHDLAKLPFHLF
ncbi:unnamed protein product [Bursaphelenchus xylophilus]|uniref:(pine wood nematode) hypothetical protein n=1 Tax=Bursaphelenchus xylophilus TaxID=6326 RepID=A0A1I7SWR4_BURXY|nr:unnamed protein product [Bursaphelenchus xylophilus]CAG9099835.1 unnamed protein product [Bursaphelenchus xylophilus]